MLCNLVVDLASEFSFRSVSGIEIGPPERADDRTLAWVDETFGGAWSSEVAAGATIVARRSDAPVGFATIDAQGLKYRWLAGLAREPNVGLFGPFGVAPSERKTGLGVQLLRRALEALRERGYARALIAAVGDEPLIRYYADAVGASVAERVDRDALVAPSPRTVVMASGSGSNFEAVVKASLAGTLPIEIVGLVCNVHGVKALRRADKYAISVSVMPWNRETKARSVYDTGLLEEMQRYRPDLVLLLGWMHLLPEAFVKAFPQMLNLHPAFLPLDPRRDDVVMPDGSRIASFRGAHAVRDAIVAGSGWTGATVHRVTVDTDRGPVLARKPLRIEPGEIETKLMDRLHQVEHRLVPAAITRWLFERPPTTS